MTLVLRGADTEGNAKPAGGIAAHTEGWETSATAQGAHAEGLTTVASATFSHAEGWSSTASGQYAHAEGIFTFATTSAAHAEGDSTNASGVSSHAEGSNTAAFGSCAHAQGSYSSAPRRAQHAHASGYLSSAGDAQAIALVVRRQTTDATPAALTSNPGVAVVLAATDATVLTLTASRGFRFRIEAIARNTATGAGEYAAWTITGTVVRGSTGNARTIGTPVVTTEADAGAAAWTLALSVDTSNATYNYLALTATGEAAKTIKWVAAIYATEVG